MTGGGTPLRCGARPGNPNRSSPPHPTMRRSGHATFRARPDHTTAACVPGGTLRQPSGRHPLRHRHARTLVTHRHHATNCNALYPTRPNFSTSLKVCFSLLFSVPATPDLFSLLHFSRTPNITEGGIWCPREVKRHSLQRAWSGVAGTENRPAHEGERCSRRLSMFCRGVRRCAGVVQVVSGVLHVFCSPCASRSRARQVVSADHLPEAKPDRRLAVRMPRASGARRGAESYGCRPSSDSRVRAPARPNFPMRHGDHAAVRCGKFGRRVPWNREPLRHPRRADERAGDARPPLPAPRLTRSGCRKRLACTTDRAPDDAPPRGISRMRR